MNRFFRSALFPLVVIVLLVYLASQTLIPRSKNAEKLTYSELQTHVKQHDILGDVVFTPSKQEISGTLKSTNKKFKVYYKDTRGEDDEE